jgi:hypothetical protein
MADRHRHPDTGVGPDHGAGTPRWVKVFGSVYIVAVLAFVILMLTGNAPDHATPWGWL